MFPVTITLHDAAQLSAVTAALSPDAYKAPKPAKPVSAPTTPQAPPAAPTIVGAVADAPLPTPAPVELPTSAPEVDFETLKKAFLALATKPNGRALCEGVLKPLGLAKLSDAKPDQYADIFAAINKAAS